MPSCRILTTASKSHKFSLLLVFIKKKKRLEYPKLDPTDSLDKQLDLVETKFLHCYSPKYNLKLVPNAHKKYTQDSNQNGPMVLSSPTSDFPKHFLGGNIGFYKMSLCRTWGECFIMNETSLNELELLSVGIC